MSRVTARVHDALNDMLTRSVRARLMALALASAVTALACGGGATSTTPTAPSTTATTTPTTGGTGSGTTSLPAWYAQFGSAVQVSVSGSEVMLRTNSVPDHASYYFGAGHASYEAPHAGMQPNQHRIVGQTVTLRVPVTPSMASTPTDTPLGPIGVAINGVVFFNQYAAQRQPLTFEILSFDRYNGHPTPTNQYHYHLEPLWLTQAGRSRLLGVLLDGYPAYGPAEAGGAVPSGLDSCNGHTHATSDFPAGMYHYHFTEAVPYLAGCHRGVRGSVG